MDLSGLVKLAGAVASGNPIVIGIIFGLGGAVATFWLFLTGRIVTGRSYETLETAYATLAVKFEKQGTELIDALAINRDRSRDADLMLGFLARLAPSGGSFGSPAPAPPAATPARPPRKPRSRGP